LAGVARRWCYLVPYRSRDTLWHETYAYHSLPGMQRRKTDQRNVTRKRRTGGVARAVGTSPELVGPRLTSNSTQARSNIGSIRYSSREGRTALTKLKTLRPPRSCFRAYCVRIVFRIVLVSYQYMHCCYLVYALTTLVDPSFVLLHCCTAGHTTRSCSPLLFDLMSDPRLSPSRIQKKIPTSLVQIIQLSIA